MISHKQAFLQYLAQTSPAPQALEVVKANGMYLRTRDGKRYLDLISGIGVCNLGHRHPAIMKAIRKQLGKYTHTMVYGEHVQQPQVQLGKKLAELLPDDLNTTFLVNSGSEAIEGAMKLAKRYTGRSKLVACKLAYHGSTQGALSLMSDGYYSDFFRPLLPDVHFVEYNNVSDLAIIDHHTAAFVVEIVQGEAGYIPGTKDFLEEAARRCKSHGALLVVDEIQTGMGRTGHLFAFEAFKLIPDVLCLAKAFGGGMPIGAFIASKNVMQCLADKPVLGHITTFGGHPVSAAAALETLRTLRRTRYISEVGLKGELFRAHLNHKAIRSITGKGLMLAVELESAEAVQKTIANMLEKGVITDWFLFAPNKIRLAPPLIIQEKEILKVCKVMHESIQLAMG